MRKIIIFCFILCLSSNLGAVRIYYCFNKNTETVTVSRSAKDPIVYRSFVHDIDESNHGIVTIHPLMDVHGIGMWENRRDAQEYYPIVSIDDNAFAGCYWITRINIPASIKTIGRNVFMECENLREIYVDANNPYFTSDDGVLYNKEKTILIKFPAGKDASSFTIPETVKEIADDAFEGVKMDNNTVSQETGNPNYDVTINYQRHNAQAYVGETLYLLPLTGSWYGEKISERYHNFKSTIYQDGYDMYAGPNSGLNYQYKFDPTDYRDNKTGTHKRHIEGHRFYVDKAVQDPNDDMIWTFHLTDLNTGENLKFIYYAEITDGSIFQDFPFITEKHYKYCKSLIGSKLVFGTISKHAPDLGTTYYSTFEKDINTGETINYDKSYAKWTIKDVEIDVYHSCISFIVTNGKQTTKVPYNIQYSDTYSMHYNNCTRVFPETQWNKLVKKYGEAHMESIMANIPLDDMSKEELYMVGGRYVAKGLYKEDNKSAVETIGESVVKSTKETISDGVKIIKSIFK